MDNEQIAAIIFIVLIVCIYAYLISNINKSSNPHDQQYSEEFMNDWWIS